MKKCECYDLSLSNLNTRMALPVRPCLNLSDYECLDAMKRNFDVNACRQVYCPLECSSIKYDLGLSTLLKNGVALINKMLEICRFSLKDP